MQPPSEEADSLWRAMKFSTRDATVRELQGYCRVVKAWDERAPC